ncbi:hypothetical protein [Anaerovibrio lipolyticus]|uniref:hypothetical protein n=1 Tax=Anaerovibrio lipolyticus TaxID=82374 RepID=UPI0026F362AA|nr:hypothetical protein [Anaerovibrio lipolyticus]MBE6105729.1 hypothetical protein [Anaerovibrio lipolyticus]
MLFARVKNLQGTTDHTPERFGYDTWKSFWEARMNQHFQLCANIKCSNSATVGGHVIRVDKTSKKWYIVPLCSSCNHFGNDNPFLVDSSKLCPANS